MNCIGLYGTSSYPLNVAGSLIIHSVAMVSNELLLQRYSRIAPVQTFITVNAEQTTIACG